MEGELAGEAMAQRRLVSLVHSFTGTPSFDDTPSFNGTPRFNDTPSFTGTPGALSRPDAQFPVLSAGAP
jgi:hypothetical protein